MTKIIKLSRRDLFRLTAAVGGGLILGSSTTGCSDGKKGTDPIPFQQMQAGVYIQIDTEGQVTVYVHRTEMGQGVRTSLSMLVAEEMELDWTQVSCEGVVADAKYGSMSTGGSKSIRNFSEALLDAGAAARTMLVAAAAQIWQVETSACTCEMGQVLHPASDRQLSYGELVPTASELAVPTDFNRKDPADYALIGTSLPRLDTPEKVDGSGVFAIDVRLPDMRFAVVARSPSYGGSVSGFSADACLAIDGVERVEELSSGVAVVASNSWAAMRGRDALEVTWDLGPDAALDDVAIQAILDQKEQEAPVQALMTGDPATALTDAVTRLDAVYEAPFLAHAAMEPLSCVAHVEADGCTIWAPTQDPMGVRDAVALALGLTSTQVQVHTPLVGSSFGRGYRTDYVIEAAELSAAIGGPVQIVWTREDDIRNGFHRPLSRHILAGGLDQNGDPSALSHTVVAPSINSQLRGVDLPLDASAVEGLRDMPYTIPNLYVGYNKANTPVPICWWRSVYMSQNPFANECFLDELALAAGKNPLDLRSSLLADTPRLSAVLQRAATEAGWGSQLPAGQGQGLACTKAYGSHVAMVIQVQADAPDLVEVQKVVCAVDCGRVVNPDTVEAQIEGAIVFGLSAALYGRISLNAGGVAEGNFDSFPTLAFDEMPPIEVHLIDSQEASGGVGELGIGPVAPALGNAIFAACGTRVRSLPFKPV